MAGSEPSIASRVPGACYHLLKLMQKPFKEFMREREMLGFHLVRKTLRFQAGSGEENALDDKSQGRISQYSNADRCLPELLIVGVRYCRTDPFQAWQKPFWRMYVVFEFYSAEQMIELRLKGSSQQFGAVHDLAPLEQVSFSAFPMEVENSHSCGGGCCPAAKHANPVAEAVLFASDAPLCLRKCISGQQVSAEAACKAAERRQYSRAVMMLPHERMHTTSDGTLTRVC